MRNLIPLCVLSLALASCQTPAAPVYVGAVVMTAAEGSTGVSADGSVGADKKTDTSLDPKAVGEAVRDVKAAPLPAPVPADPAAPPRPGPAAPPRPGPATPPE